MEVQLWCVAVDGGGGGTPARLVIRELQGPEPIVLSSDTEQRATRDFKEAIERARKLTQNHIGWPEKKSFEVSIDCADEMNLPLPKFLYGGSHFGAVVLGLFQAVALTAPECVPVHEPDFLRVLQSVCLESVAITACCDEVGGFKPVGLLRQKLAGLSMPALSPRPAVCFLATGQNLETPEGPLPKVFNGLALREVSTPLSAFRKLWLVQTKSLARCL